MKYQQGFTLIELAIVLFILSLLLGGMLVPLASHIEGRQRAQAMDQLEQIKEALIGFAMINGRLPCYTIEPDPNSPDYGEEELSCSPGSLSEDGILPWKTLGLDRGYDPWGVERTGVGDPWTGYWRYRVDSSFYDSFDLSTDSSDELRAIRVKDGNEILLTSNSERPVAIIYSTGANQEPDGRNASYEQTAADNPTYQGGPPSGDFDDITVWLTRPSLFYRMVSAGRLP